MKNVKLLDCTLRDGGYVNDWNFGHSVITGTYKRLDAAGVDYVEAGFIDERVRFDADRSVCPDTDGFNKIFEGIKKRHSVPVAMIDYGTCSIENIQDCEDTFIDGIRVIFKKEKIREALPFCRKIREKGYKLFIQAVSVTSYTDREWLDYIQQINEMEPYAFSIVDTYGLLDDRRLKNYFYMADHNLNPGIKIGYHAHNNFQLAFSNSIKFLGMETQREIIADASVYGMGKSAGNCPGELIAMHMNQYYGKEYDINQLLEILDTSLMPVYAEHYWGYKYNFYISAMQNVHPAYVQYLLDKKTLAVSSVNAVLSKIPEEKKLLYDEEYIEHAYLDYQMAVIDDEHSISRLQGSLGKKKILLIGPGSSIKKNKDKIQFYITGCGCTVISVNFVPDEYRHDFVFVSNAKRFCRLADSCSGPDMNEKLIITSNITPYGCRPGYVLNLKSLMDVLPESGDNALVLCIEMLARAGVKEAVLAGFDGFTAAGDYYRDDYSFAGNEQYLARSNGRTAENLGKLSELVKISFLTDSLYQEGMQK